MPQFLLFLLAGLLWGLKCGLGQSQNYNQIQEAAINLIQFIPSSCYNSSDCINSQCTSQCLECQSQEKCLKCAYGHFLFNESQCVQCPDYNLTISSFLIIHCADCVEQGLSWQNSRSCSFYYQKSGESHTFMYYKRYYTTAKFYKIELTNTSNDQGELSTTTQFKIQFCEGCSGICQNYSACTQCDISNMCFSCGNGYYLNSSNCQKCQPGCISCLYSSQYKREVCTKCQQGMALNPNYTCSNCSSEIDKCSSCFYGDSYMNLTRIAEQGKISLEDSSQQQSQSQLEQQLTFRCMLCASGFIQNLNFTRCVPCEAHCTICDYQNGFTFSYHFYSGQFTIVNQPELILMHQFRCLQCQKNYFYHYNGVECIACSINDCERCYYGNDTVINGVVMATNTFFIVSDADATSFNFMMRCQYCKSGYAASNDKRTCSPFSDPIGQPNCDVWQQQQASHRCVKCKNGYTLFNDLCTQPCELENCASCYAYLDAIDLIRTEICIQCQLGGYYVSTSGCKPCLQGCNVCAMQSYKYALNLTEYLLFVRPTFTSSQLNLFESEQQIIHNICEECQYTMQIIQSDGSCKGCDPSCQTCVIANASSIGQAYVCIQCPSRMDSFGLVKYSMNGQLLQQDDLTSSSYQKSCGAQYCPHFCSGCRLASQSEKSRINPSFAPQSSSYNEFSKFCFACSEPNIENMYLFYDQQLGRCFPCPIITQSPESCKRKLKDFTFFLDCEGFDLEFLMIDGQRYTVYSLTSLIYFNYNVIYIQEVENDVYYNTFNILGITESNYNLYYLVHKDTTVTCTFPTQFYITTRMRQNIFSMQTVRINFGTYERNTNEYNKYYANLVTNTNIFANFTHVKFDRVNFISYADVVFGQTSLMRLHIESPQLLTVEIRLQNVNFLSFNLSRQNQLHLHFDNPENVILENVTFLNIENFPDQHGLVTIMNKLSSHIRFTFRNVSFQGCSFKGAYLFDFSQHQNIYIQIQHPLLFSQCLFNYSQFFLLGSDQYQSSYITINGLEMQHSILEDSVLLQASSSQLLDSVNVGNLEITNCSFTASTKKLINLFDVNSLNSFINATIRFNQFWHVTLLRLYYNEETAFIVSFRGLKVSNNSFSGALLYAEAAQSRVLSVNFSQLFFFNNTVSQLNTNIQIFLQALNLNYVIFQEVIDLDNQFLCILNAQLADKIYLSNISLNDSFMQNSSHASIDISEFTSLIFVEDLTIQGKYLVDSSIISIKSSQLYKSLEGEGASNDDVGRVQMRKIKLLNNSMNQLGEVIQMAPIFIYSFYSIFVEASEIMAIGNRMNLLPPTSYFSSCSGLLVQSIQSNVTLSNSQFINQTSSKQKNGLYINAKNILIYNAIFDGGNSIISSDELGNQGGLATFQFQRLEIKSSQFQNAKAQQGGALHLIPIVKAEIIISGSYFQNTQTPLKKGQISQGGCLYLDASEAVVNFTIENCTFQYLLSYEKGGFMFISSRLSMILTIRNSSFQNTFSWQGGLIYQKQPMNLTFEKNNIQNSPEFMNQITREILLMDIQEAFNSLIPRALFVLENNFVKFIDNMFVLTVIVNILDMKGGVFEDHGSIYSNIYLFFGPLFNIYSAQTVRLERMTVQDIFQVSISYRNSTTLFIKTMIQFSADSFQCKDSHFSKINCTICYDGVLLVQDSTFINITNTTFKENIAESGGALKIVQSNFYFLQNDTLIIDESQTTRRRGSELENESRNEHKRKLQLNSPITNHISNCQFINNFATINGGAIYLENPFLQIDNVTIKGNIAGKKGGAIYSKISNYNDFIYIQLYISNTLVQNNTADIGGGFCIEGKQPVLTNNTLLENLAHNYGSDIISLAKKLQLMPNRQLHGSLLLQQPGKVPPDPLVVQMIDYSGEVLLTPEATAQVELKNHDGLTELYGSVTKTINQTAKGFFFDDIKFRGLINSEFAIRFTSISIAIPQFNQNGSHIGYSNNYELVFNVKLLSCLLGEVYIEATKECQFCKQNTYSINAEVPQCQQCPKIMANCPGGAVIELAPGYWRMHNMTDKIVYCKNNPLNCEGGSENFTCRQGYIGAMCEACDINKEVWEEHYSNSQKYSCYSCALVTNNALKVFFLVLWTLVSVSISVRGTARLIMTTISLNYLYKMGFITGGKSSQAVDLTSVYIKIFTNYFQIIITISYFDLAMPSDIFSLPTLLGSPVEQMSYSLDCFMLQVQNIVPHIYFRAMWSLLMPFFYLLVLFILYGAYLFFTKAKAIRSIVFTIMIYLLIYLQPSMVYQLIELVSCRNIADVSYIKANVSYICYSDQHFHYLITTLLPALFIWVLIFPGILFIQVRRAKKNLHKISVLFKYGFLYQEYKETAYLWEFLKIYEKILINIFLNIYDTEIKVKGIMSFIVVFIYALFAIKFAPYKQKILNRLDMVSTIVCCITIILGILAYQNPYNYIVWISFLIILVQNIAFIIKMIRQIIMGFTDKFEEKIDQFLKYLILKFPFIGSYIHYSHVQRTRIFHLWRVLRKHTQKTFLKQLAIKEIKRPQNVDSKNSEVGNNTQNMLMEKCMPFTSGGGNKSSQIVAKIKLSPLSAAQLIGSNDSSQQDYPPHNNGDAVDLDPQILEVKSVRVINNLPESQNKF